MWTSNRGHIFRVAASNVIILACFRMGLQRRILGAVASFTRFEPDSVRKTEVTADSTI